MEEKIIKEFWDIISMFETTLLALKWQQHNNYIPKQDSIIAEFDIALDKLKVCCFNNIGNLE